MQEKGKNYAFTLQILFRPPCLLVKPRTENYSPALISQIRLNSPNVVSSGGPRGQLNLNQSFFFSVDQKYIFACSAKNVNCLVWLPPLDLPI